MKKDNLDPIAITGLGICHELGTNIDEFWKNLLKGLDVTHEAEHFNSDVFRASKTIFISEKTKEKLSNNAHIDVVRFGCHAATEAIKQAGLENSLEELGLSIGTTSGGLIDSLSEKLLSDNFKDVHIKNITDSYSHSAMSGIADQLGVGGPVYNFSMACASSGVAIHHACEILRSGGVEIMLAGGCDRVRPADYAGFNALRAMSSTMCTPFDENRTGLVMGDGAAFLLLEKLSHAKARKADVIGIICGEGITNDAFHSTAPDYDGIMRAMNLALQQAGVSSSEIDYINTHGTGTTLNDDAEIVAINKIFKENKKSLSVSSSKATTGHLLGSSGAIEALITALVLKNQKIPLTKNTEKIDKKIKFDLVIRESKDKKIGYAMSNSLGFGGNNISILLKKSVLKEES